MLYKISRFSTQNCDLKFPLWIKLIHLCVFKYEFGSLKLFREGGSEIMYVPRPSDQVNWALGNNEVLQINISDYHKYG